MDAGSLSSHGLAGLVPSASAGYRAGYRGKNQPTGHLAGAGLASEVRGSPAGN